MVSCFFFFGLKVYPQLITSWAQVWYESVDVMFISHRTMVAAIVCNFVEVCLQLPLKQHIKIQHLPVEKKNNSTEQLSKTGRLEE